MRVVFSRLNSGDSCASEWREKMSVGADRGGDSWLDSSASRHVHKADMDQCKGLRVVGLGFRVQRYVPKADMDQCKEAGGDQSILPEILRERN